jgi:hypothetical protein
MLLQEDRVAARATVDLAAVLPTPEVKLGPAGLVARGSLAATVEGLGGQVKAERASVA